MPPKKEKAERIKPFKQDSTSIWLGFRHYQVVNGELILAAGGSPCKERYEKVKKYFKKKRKL